MATGTPQAAAPPAPVRGVFGGGAWSLGRISGIEIAVDHSWVLIFALITFSLGSRFGAAHESWSDVQAWSAALVTSLLFFASIVLHELGHSLTAQRFGLRVRSITLFVVGGVARLESEPKRPADEVVIAAAGPLVSVLLGLGFALLAETGLGGETVVAIFDWLGTINVFLAVFNCVPGFPLDGGRVLRGIVWAATGSFERATRIAAGSGTLVAYGLIFFGIVTALVSGNVVSGIWLAFIGWFLLTAARSSVGQVQIERILSRVRGIDAIERVEEATVSGGESVAQLANEAVLRRGLRTFYVVDPAGNLRGLATLRELASVPADARPHTRIDQVMLPAERVLVLQPRESAWVALQRMAEHGVNQLPVVDGGRLLGAVTRERLLGVVQAGLTLEATQRS